MRRFLLVPLLLLITGCGQPSAETASNSQSAPDVSTETLVLLDGPADTSANNDTDTLIMLPPPEPADEKETGETQVKDIPYTSDSLETVKQNIENGSAVIIDVRNQDEWDESHLKIAKLIPVSEFADESTREAAVNEVPKDKIVYVHCKMGGRAGMCGQVLGNLGYDVRPLKMRFEEIVAGGFEVESK